jgi:glycosyltransferase involved in cell wall biosynthesis
MSAALAMRGHEVDVVTTTLADRGSWSPLPRSPGLEGVQVGERIFQDGYHVTYCRTMWPTRWATSRQMLPVLQKLVPLADAVHIHGMYLFPTLLASRLAPAHRVPYVLRPHGILDPYIRSRHRVLKRVYHAAIEDGTLKQAAAIHFTTEQEQGLAKPVLPSGVRTCVIPLGVDVADYDMLPDRSLGRKVFQLPDDALVCLFHGRLNHKKGLDILAPAFVRLCGEVPRAHLILAGPDDDGLGRLFVAECREGGVASHVVCPGLLDPRQIKLAFAAADFWVLPSYSENFGVAVVEAMAAGLPVVVTNRVNLCPMVLSAGAGIVTRPDVESFLAGMLEMASQPADNRIRMGEAGKTLCQQQYSWARVSEELEVLYREIRVA